MNWTAKYIVFAFFFINCISFGVLKPSVMETEDTSFGVGRSGEDDTRQSVHGENKMPGPVSLQESDDIPNTGTFLKGPKQYTTNLPAGVVKFESESRTSKLNDVDRDTPSVAQNKMVFMTQERHSNREESPRLTNTEPLTLETTTNEPSVAIQHKRKEGEISRSVSNSPATALVMSEKPVGSFDFPRKRTNQDSFKSPSTPHNERKLYMSESNMDLVDDESEQCCNVTEFFADCRFCNLSYVPTNLPENISHLFLSYNNLTSMSLYSGVFARYSKLVVLQLDSNHIESLPVGVFDGLIALKYLDIYNNSLIMDDNFPGPEVFSPIKATLTNLKMNKNNVDVTSPNLKYPDKSMSALTHLKYLYIDGLSEKDFGPGFADMLDLTHLTISGFQQGNCNMSSIKASTFQYFGQLEYLNISDCYLKGSLVDKNAFTNLTSLQLLDVSNNFNLGIDAVGKFMFGLEDNKNFRHLKMQRIGTRFASCIVVYNHTLRHFKNSRLEVIEAMDNEIEMIEVGALRMLPTTLRRVNLTNNKITFGAYWRDLAALEGIYELHLDGFSNPERFPEFYPPKDLHCGSRQPHHTSGLGDDLDKNACFCRDEDCEDLNPADKKFILPLPPNLRTATMHSNSLTYTITNISFCKSNKLETVDISGNMFHKLIGPVSGLHHLKKLSMSSCFIEEIYYHFFDNMTSLEYLNLYQNLLGDSLNNDQEGDTFDTLPNLKYLNISFNNLYRLNKPVFKNLAKLEYLDMSINRISVANFTIGHMKNLKLLDLHKNQISSLNVEMRNHITHLKKHKGVPIKVDMRQNPIACTCTNLPFLEWVLKYNVFGDNYTLYYCKYESVNDNAVEMREGYQRVVEGLRRVCGSNVTLFLGVIGGTLLIVIIIAGVLIHRFRWTLRYWYHAAKLKIYSNPTTSSEEFDYDVFISYARGDEDFVLEEIYPNLTTQRNLRLMIHGEKFQAGRHITDNIYMAVTQCRKTLVLVTRNMLASHWCTYELQMARMEAISRGRNVLVFLFKEEIPASEVSVDVLSYIKTSTYITYPSESEHRETFWNKLADDLRDR